MTTTFKLPDLGEGLPEAEIVTWHVSVGQRVKVDELLVSVETAKAVVEVPSPYTGVIARLHAGEGDMVATGAALVDFDEVGAGEQPAAAPADDAPAADDVTAARAESQSVVGSMPSSDDMLVETAVPGSRRSRDHTPRAAPAARKLADELGVTLSQVAASGS